jgi:hypothetical protein
MLPAPAGSVPDLGQLTATAADGVPEWSDSATAKPGEALLASG